MTQRVLTVAGLKGGIGKTAVAVNLADHWQGGRQTLLIDADPNGSALKWHERSGGQLSARCVPIQRAPMEMAKPWDLVLMDTAGGSRDEQRTYAEGSNYVVCPCQPGKAASSRVLDLASSTAPG